ncbi:SDR family oxidoreductase [Streptomyces sp. NPDC005134]|uniref:SDR family oxidoreductase n=1 Tax=Streptomyces sp. NPDC005098 TaxID=3154560 RepID=UPI0033BA5990
MIRLSCPATGTSPTVNCPRRPTVGGPPRIVNLTDPRQRSTHPAARPTAIAPLLPAGQRPDICHQKSITIRPGELGTMEKFRQDLRYLTNAWISTFKVVRAQNVIWGTGDGIWSLTEQQWTEMMDVNLTGGWKAAKAVIPHLMERGSGSIVITSSMNGLEAGPDNGHYITAKHGVIGLVKSLALDQAPYGIRCNALAPGVIETPMLANDMAYDYLNGGPGGTAESLGTAGSHYHALKGSRALPAQTVADACLWLNSSLASSITGVTVPVDAGHLLLPGFNHAPKV